MRDILPNLLRWRERGDAIALATVIKTWGSAPRPAGAKMAVNESGEMIGSVSGGCVENAVIVEARNVLKIGTPKLLRFGVTDDEAWEVGLACGGTIEVFVESLASSNDLPQSRIRAGPSLAVKSSLLAMLLSDVESGTAAVLATITCGAESEIGTQLLFRMSGEVLGDKEDTTLVEFLLGHAQRMFGQERTETVRIGEREIFLESFCPAPKLVLIGAVHIAIPLVTFAKELGFKVILVDPRQAFATPQRFPHVDQLLARWPEEAFHEIGIDSGTCIVVLTHDPKLDDPAVKVALQENPAYVGVLGSHKTHEKRMRRLQDGCIAPEQLARLHAPIGIDIGGRTPAEIALSIMAEIVAVRRSLPAKQN